MRYRHVTRVYYAMKAIAETSRLTLTNLDWKCRLDQLKAELQLVQDSRAKQEKKVEDLRQACTATDAQVQLLSSTLPSLETEAEKLELLAQGIQEMQVQTLLGPNAPS